MSKFKAIEGWDRDELIADIEKGGRFVLFSYCVSVVLLTLKRPTSVYYVPAGEQAVVRSLPWTVLTLLLGWWGFPWGPIHTLGALVENLRGGTDVTREVMAQLATSSDRPDGKRGTEPITPIQAPRKATKTTVKE